MVKLKGKILTLLLTVVVLALIFSPSVKALARIRIYGYVDKVQYTYGENGKLKIWILNEGTEPVILHNITVKYPWNAILPWEGNETLKEIDEVIPIGGNGTYSFDFAVPDDRGVLSYNFGIPEIEVTVVTDKVTDDRDIILNIVNPPVNTILQDMDNLVTLITVQIIIAIIAAIIIAAAVFLSGRRPRVTWQKEE